MSWMSDFTVVPDDVAAALGTAAWLAAAIAPAPREAAKAGPDTRSIH